MEEGLLQKNGGEIGDTTRGTASEIAINDAGSKGKNASIVSRMGLFVLILLAVQNCSKNLLMRYVMRDQPKFLTSVAVLGSECIKLSCSVFYILCIQRKPLKSIFQFLKDDCRNTILLTVPGTLPSVVNKQLQSGQQFLTQNAPTLITYCTASAYNFQMSMEYVALANLNAAMFSVLVQCKLLFTATFAATILQKRLKVIQVISLVLLTSGVMLCNFSKLVSSSSSEEERTMLDAKTIKGISATLSIALSSGFASVYTEKVIKGQGKRIVQEQDYGLAYTQVQLAGMSIVTIGLYATARDWKEIVANGLFYNFSFAAFLSVASSAMGGLIVASVLKYADSVLKGYATAMSVILTGVLSKLLFGTELNVIYFMGIVNVVTSVILYNGRDLDQYVCAGSPEQRALKG